MNDLLATFNHSDYLPTDPIRFAHDYQNSEDREVISLIAALFSFGNVSSIQSTLRQILKPLGMRPKTALSNLSDDDIREHWKSAYYRFYTAKDIQTLMRRLRDLLRENASIESYFEKSSNRDLTTGLSELREYFLRGSKISPGLRFMFADPNASSAKRWHMWLRWVVRKDQIDLGLWTVFKPSQLILPLDTHVFEMVRHLGLTRAKSPSRRVALEVTDKLRDWDPHDPIKYDFALCRLGVLGLKKKIIQKSAR